MKNLLRALNERPIAYYPIYRKLTGSTTAGILLSQLMFWFSKKDKFYKTNEDLMSETMLTENELRTAKSKIKKLDFIKVTVEGLPAKTYYEIDYEKYESSLVEFTDTVPLNPPNTDSDIHTAITKTTSKTTTKSKEEEEKRDKKDFIDKKETFIEKFFKEPINKVFRNREVSIDYETKFLMWVDNGMKLKRKDALEAWKAFLST